MITRPHLIPITDEEREKGIIKGYTGLKHVLLACEEYFDERADADQPAGCDSPIPNDEMRMLILVREGLADIAHCQERSRLLLEALGFPKV